VCLQALANAVSSDKALADDDECSLPTAFKGELEVTMAALWQVSSTDRAEPLCRFAERPSLFSAANPPHFHAKHAASKNMVQHIHPIY